MKLALVALLVSFTTKVMSGESPIVNSWLRQECGNCEEYPTTEELKVWHKKPGRNKYIRFPSHHGTLQGQVTKADKEEILLANLYISSNPPKPFIGPKHGTNNIAFNVASRICSAFGSGWTVSHVYTEDVPGHPGGRYAQLGCRRLLPLNPTEIVQRVLGIYDSPRASGKFLFEESEVPVSTRSKVSHD